MPDRLSGKVALITGGTSGIGEATVELFVAEGAKVVFTGRNAEKGAEMEKALGGNARFFRADVRNEQEVKASVDETVRLFGRIDCLFNNAGGRTNGVADTITQEDFEDAMNLLLGSVLFGIKYATPYMKAQGGGSIINNSSVAAQRSHMGGYLYSIAKAGVSHAGRIAGVALGKYGIRVNAISPGAIATPIFLGGSDIAAGMDQARVEQKMAKLEGNLGRATPLLRSGFPIDIATMALFLASDEAKHITCQDIAVDGGMTAGGRTNFEEEAPAKEKGSPT
jgi:NAD(P)-dependent dehydrogenase (short-subunit alcohol dehydrogenase family)